MVKNVSPTWIEGLELLSIHLNTFILFIYDYKVYKCFYAENKNNERKCYTFILMGMYNLPIYAWLIVIISTEYVPICS